MYKKQASYSIIPLMPIIMTEIKDKFKKNASNNINTASSLYNSSFGIGSIIGPMLGANLNSYYGFRVCAYILGPGYYSHLTLPTNTIGDISVDI